jgi:hypothetical protein
VGRRRCEAVATVVAVLAAVVMGGGGGGQVGRRPRRLWAVGMR